MNNDHNYLPTGGNKSFWKLTPYFSEKMAENMRIYKYAGGDRGFLYRCFYNPVASKLVTYLPETLA